MTTARGFVFAIVILFSRAHPASSDTPPTPTSSVSWPETPLVDDIKKTYTGPAWVCADKAGKPPTVRFGPTEMAIANWPEDLELQSVQVLVQKEAALFPGAWEAEPALKMTVTRFGAPKKTVPGRHTIPFVVSDRLRAKDSPVPTFATNKNVRIVVVVTFLWQNESVSFSYLDLTTTPAVVTPKA